MPRSATAEQYANLGRVQQSIGDAIERWCRARQAEGRPRFHGSELEAAVCSETGCTPGSPLRIFRQAIRSGVIRGRLVSRADSLYELGEPSLPGSHASPPAGPRRTPSRRGPVGGGALSQAAEVGRPFPTNSGRPSPTRRVMVRAADKGLPTGSRPPAGRKAGTSSRACPCGCHLDPGPIVRCFHGG